MTCGGYVVEAIIFDFDGVIADSEILANQVLAERVTALGLLTTLDDALHLYMGKRWAEAVTLIEQSLGKPLPTNFPDDLKAATLGRFRTELKEVPGAARFIGHFKGLPRCIASSSSADRLQVSLEILNLIEQFDGRVFSADLVERGKPEPDIFLYAARQMGVEASKCIVIEDSVSGVHAAKAAGMTIVGLCAASHIRDGHSRRLSEAGATYVAASWEDALEFVNGRVGVAQVSCD